VINLHYCPNPNHLCQVTSQVNEAKNLHGHLSPLFSSFKKKKKSTIFYKVTSEWVGVFVKSFWFRLVRPNGRVIPIDCEIHSFAVIHHNLRPILACARSFSLNIIWKAIIMPNRRNSIEIQKCNLFKKLILFNSFIF
jgi:hypothetical protein